MTKSLAFNLSTVRQCVFLALMYVIVCGFFPTFASAANLESRSAFPSPGTNFYDGDTITFLGESVNIGGTVIGQGGWADVEIDWESDGTADVSYNAFDGDGDGENDDMLGAFVAGAVKPLEKELVAPPGGHPLGTHRYRFNTDTTNQLAETNEVDNRSSWRSFTITETPFAPVITLAASPNPITVGASTTVTWSATNADSCTFEPAGWNNANALSGSQSVSPLVTTIYTIECVGPGGSASKEFTIDVVTPAPVITFNASPSVIATNGSANLTWSTTHATACTGTSNPAGWNATGITGNVSVSPATTTTYMLNCSGSGGSSNQTQVINVNPGLPQLTFTVTPENVVTGGTVAATWNAVGATSCYASGGPSGWTGSKNPNGGSLNFTINSSVTFTMSCGNQSSGTNTQSVQIFPTGLPDLRAATVFSGANRIELASGALVVGQPASFRAQVENIGTATTSIGITNRFTFKWGWTNWETVGYVGGAAVPPGGRRLPFDESSSTILAMSGLMEVGWCADTPPGVSDPRVTESNETNNCAWRIYEVLGTAGSPTLTMTTPNPVSVNPIYQVGRIPIGATTTISWNATGATSCTAQRDGTPEATWNGAMPTSGTAVVQPTATTSYSMICTDSVTGLSVIKAIRMNVTVRPPQILSFTATPGSVAKGSSVVLDWVATSSANCLATSTPYNAAWTGPKSNINGSQEILNLTTDTQFRLTCTSPTGGGGFGGNAVRQVLVGTYEPPPAITITAEQNPITPLDSTGIQWTVTGADTCTAQDGDASWTGAKDPVSGSTTVSPDVSTLFTLSCTGPGGTASQEVTLTVVTSAPIIAASVLDNLIIEGPESTTLYWDILGASSCDATSNPNDGAWDALTSEELTSSEGGSIVVSPDVTTVYAIDCTGPWGNTSFPFTVEVLKKANITDFQICTTGEGAVCVDIGGNPTSENSRFTINPGVPLEITWAADSDTATFCTAISGSGHSLNGEISGDRSLNALALPGQTYEYTIACGTAGILTNQADIYIETNPVSPDIWISPRVLPPGGGDLTVNWDTNNGDQSVCSINGGGLDNGLLVAGTDLGSETLRVEARTTFTITCGAETDSVTVELSPTLWES